MDSHEEIFAVAKSLPAEERAAYLEKGRPRSDVADAALITQDLFYLERSLAGGCH